MNTLDTLIAARKLIEDPAHWTKGSYIEMDGGYSAVGAYLRALVRQPELDCADFIRGNVCHMCSVGALLVAETPEVFCDEDSIWVDHVPEDTVKALSNTPIVKEYLSIDWARHEGAATQVISFNDSDSTVHEDVLQMFDEAIAHEEAKNGTVQ